MPFRPPKKEKHFADLKGILAQSRDTDNALYQVVQEIIERLDQNKAVVADKITDIIENLNILQNVATKFASYITENDELAVLPNSLQLLAGTGITFDSSVPNKLTINSSAAGADHVPMSTGAEPLEIMSDGAGQVLLVAFVGP